MTVGEFGELALVAALRSIFDRNQGDVEVRNGDDGLVWRPTRRRVVATIDSVVEGVDWLPDRTPPAAVGHRAAAVTLSDLAAMGARPRLLLLALELPPQTPLESVLGAARGLAALADECGAAVAGGDVGFSEGPARWTTTGLGDLAGPPLTRGTAQAGDIVWLVGAVGAAALGLDLLREGFDGAAGGWRQFAILHHWWPAPQVKAALRLQRKGGGRWACIDVSDGLGLDAGRLAAASGVALELDVPTPAWLGARGAADCDADGRDWRHACAAGGDDYALLVTAPAGARVGATVRGTGAAALAIGRVHAGPPGEVALTVDGVRCSGGGWRHGDTR